jgi:hypothetical protein
LLTPAQHLCFAMRFILLFLTDSFYFLGVPGFDWRVARPGGGSWCTLVRARG